MQYPASSRISKLLFAKRFVQSYPRFSTTLEVTSSSWKRRKRSRKSIIAIISPSNLQRHAKRYNGKIIDDDGPFVFLPVRCQRLSPSLQKWVICLQVGWGLENQLRVLRHNRCSGPRSWQNQSRRWLCIHLRQWSIRMGLESWWKGLEVRWWKWLGVNSCLTVARLDGIGGKELGLCNRRHGKRIGCGCNQNNIWTFNKQIYNIIL